MRRLLFLLLIFSCLFAYSQNANPAKIKNYFSFQGGVNIPLGAVADNYQLGFATNFLYHIHGVGNVAEVQVQLGFQRFGAVESNGFGALTAFPIKVGWQQKIDNGFYLFGRFGALFLKDNQSTFRPRFAVDAGMLFDLKKVGLELGLSGFLKEHAGGFGNFITLGLVLPFKR